MNDPIDRVEEDYRQRLAKRCTEWQVRHPEEAKQVRAEVAVKFARVDRPEPEPGSLCWHMIEEAVTEAIRARKGWPTVRQFMLDQKPSAPYVAPRPVPIRPPVAGVDHKALASGER